MKKIVFFGGQLFGKYQVEVTTAMTQEAQRLGYQMDIFMNFGEYSSNYMYADGEKRILKIPDFNVYDAVIVAADNFEIAGMADELIAKLRTDFTGPVISLRQDIEGFYCVGIDDKLSMRKILEHFLDGHHMTKISFMTGKLDIKDARLRLECYKEVMEERGIPVTDHMIFEGNYWRNQGKVAVDWFLGGDEMPEAIVCSNDFMAISVIEELRNRGIRVPEDIAVSGFDDVEEGIMIQPPLTTMHVPNKQIGIATLQQIDNILSGQKVQRVLTLPANLCVRGTCGCNWKMETSSLQKILSRKFVLENILSQIAYMNVSFDSTDNMEMLLDTANYYAKTFSFESIFVCLCDDSNTNSVGQNLDDYPDNMVLKAILGGPTAQLVDEKFNRKDILPESVRIPGKPIYVASLHDRADTFGYIAMYLDQLDSMQHIFQVWILSVADALSKLKMYGDYAIMAEIKRQSELDPLTGIGNRRCFDKKVREYQGGHGIDARSFGMISIDMDGLKYINDTFGHQEGDEALCSVAEILSGECRENDLAARIGGDEYQVCIDTNDCKVVEDYIARVKGKLVLYNAHIGKPYELSASFGYSMYIPGQSVMECIKTADAKMYAEKRTKAHHRD